MRHSQTCRHCTQQIPLHAWICPNCGGWVADVTRFEPGDAGTAASG